MTLGELRAAINRLDKSLDNLLVGSKGYFGELDRELEGVEYYYFTDSVKAFIVLNNMPCSYEEPD